MNDKAKAFDVIRVSVCEANRLGLLDDATSVEKVGDIFRVQFLEPRRSEGPQKVPAPDRYSLQIPV